MIRAHRIRLNPTDEQRQYFMKACGTARYAYNWGVTELNNATGRKPSANALKKRFNQQKPVWAYEVTKCAAEGAFMNLGKALKNHYEGRAEAPTYKSRKKGDFSFYLANDKFKVEGHWLTVPKLGKVNMAEKLRFEGKILSATISKETDWWYVSITVEMPQVQTHPKPEQVGVDVGLLRLATLSDGESFDNKRPLRQELDHLAVLQRVLARKQKGSKNRQDVKRKIGRLHKRIRDVRNDVLHKLTTHIARHYGFVAIEDLNVKGMTKNHCLALSLQDAALGRLLTFLETKVQAQGGVVIKVDRFFPSSKSCCRCRWKNNDLTLADRVFICSNPKCQLELDRDLNAAINILNEGLRLATSLKADVAGVASNET